MFSYANRTVFDIPLTWDRARFESTRAKCRHAKKLVDISVNVQFEKQLRNQHLENIKVEQNIVTSGENLAKYDKKVQIIDNLSVVASESLPNYFDKRMEVVRSSIEEHCNAIQRIIREENEHWREIHLAIDQNLVTASDFRVSEATSENRRRIETIDEAEEENRSQLVSTNSVTSLLTNIIRKSRSIRCSDKTEAPMESQAILSMKRERQSTVIPPFNFQSFRRPNDTTYVVKIEEETQNETSRPSTTECNTTENSAPLTNSQVAASPIFSQPNPPARLYFSPTLLQDEADVDDDQEDQTTDEIKSPDTRNPVLSPLDQNQMDTTSPRVNIRRLGQTFVLNNMKTEEMNENEEKLTENVDTFVRPTISEDIPIETMDPNPIVPDIPLTSNDNQTKPTRRTRAVVKLEPRTTRVTRVAPTSIENNRGQTRKRKKSVSDDTDPKSTSIALRKRKPIPIIDLEDKNEKVETKKKTKKQPAKKKTKKKTKQIKEDDIPIREPSPLPLIDRSKHYSTRFSTRSHRLNNFTLPPLNTESDDEQQKPKSRRTRGRPKKPSDQTQKKDKVNDQTISDKTKKMTRTTRNRKTKKN